MLILPRGIQAKEVERLTESEMDWLARGEHMCRKLNLVIACPRCLNSGSQSGAVLRGQNDESDRVLKVECDHREMVFTQRAD
jgi:hypothetical protein